VRLINDAGIDAVHHGETHQAGDDGVFDLPDDVGQHLLAFEGWQHIEDDDQADDDTAGDSTDEAPQPRRRRRSS
jgi:hypothetical protein